MGRKRKEFADEVSGRTKKQKLPAEIRIEGQSYVFDAAKMWQHTDMIQGRMKGFDKELKKLKDALDKNIEDGVTKGKRTNLLFPSLEESRQTGQEAILRKHDVACGIYGEIVEAVPLDKLEIVRAAFQKAVNAALKLPAPKAGPSDRSNKEPAATEPEPASKSGTEAETTSSERKAAG